MDIKNKILEKTGYDQVFNVDDNVLSNSKSDYNSIKDNVQYRLKK